MLWLTKSTVLPPCRRPPFSPGTSSETVHPQLPVLRPHKDFRFQMSCDSESESNVHPARKNASPVYRGTSPLPRKSTISSNLFLISAFDMPRMAPFRKMFSRPVSSGWKPVPTSSRLATLPLMRTLPSVGSVIRLKILRRVDFPAPLRPIMPIRSPRFTSNDTSFRAQNSSCVLFSDDRAIVRKGADNASAEVFYFLGHDVPQGGVRLSPLLGQEILFPQRFRL